ncbi:MAG: ABC transporter permease, partial [Chloroflexota bacterium]
SSVGIVVLVVLCAAVIIGPFVWRANPLSQDLLAQMAAPSSAHPLGTDTNGRDLLARLLNGGRVSLGLSVAATLLSVVLGSGAGLIAGYVLGAVDNVLMRVMDVILSFPALLLALAISAAAGLGLINTVLAVAVPGIPLYARLMRSMVLSVRQREYVTAARATGVRPVRILWKHVVPNCLGPIVVQASIGVGLALQYVAALGYLGLGVQPPTPEWGSMLTDAQAYLLSDPLALVAPGLVIALAIVSFNLLGDALRDLIDRS